MEESRRPQILAASLPVFARYGFRKTSMDDLARAAGISRQGLYLHFATKDDLFRAAVDFALDEQLDAAVTALDDAAKPLEKRLTCALDEWLGRYVGVMGNAAGELVDASAALRGGTVAEHDERFERALARAFTSCPLKTIYASATVTPAQLAKTLHATARGFKHASASREAFVKNIAIAVRVLCAPLHAERFGD